MSGVHVEFSTVKVNLSKTHCFSREPIAVMYHVRIAVKSVFMIERVFDYMFREHTHARSNKTTVCLLDKNLNHYDETVLFLEEIEKNSPVKIMRMRIRLSERVFQF